MKKICYTLYGLLILLFTSCNQERIHPHKTLGFNDCASINSLGDLPENPLLLQGITTTIQPKDSTISTLYGNASAYNCATSDSADAYPAGAVLYYITWHSVADAQWFGANVPHVIKTIERIVFTYENNIQYMRFDGNRRKRSDPNYEIERINIIKHLKMAASPSIP